MSLTGSAQGKGERGGVGMGAGSPNFKEGKIINLVKYVSKMCPVKAGEAYKSDGISLLN